MTSRRRIADLATPSVLSHAVLALVAFVPLLLTKSGRVAADTRQHLYVDPAGFLERSFSLWDPHVHLGTVTHSNLGNVFPMGVFFRLTDLVGMPVWVAQRCWIALLLFGAGAGALFLARTLRWNAPGAFVAALVYMLSPYVLQYSTRTSVLLLPFTALPWLLALTERALRTGGWRHPALLAVVAFATAGSNVSALLLVALGPIVWLAFAAIRRDVTWSQAATTALRTGVLAVGTCALWLTALLVESGHGVDVLAYTETLEQVSTTSTANEVLRGLGYWLFYGTEARAPNVGAASDLLESTAVLLAGYLLAGLAVVAAFALRWRHRAVVVALVLVGTVVAVGAYPTSDPSLLGRAYRSVAETSSIAMALRSSTRAVPLVVLGLALVLGIAVNVLVTQRRVLGLGAAAIVVALVLAGAPALFTGEYVDSRFSRPSEIPAYWREAARALDAEGRDTRVLEIPGMQFAAYRWGITYETPILPTLLERPSVAREQIPYGSPAAADLLSAFDRRIQEGTLEPTSIAPLARLISAGTVLLRSDLEYERYAAPRPRALWGLLAVPAAGLGAPQTFGSPTENVPNARLPLLDAQTLAIPAGAEDPPPVAVFPVEEVRPVLHLRSGADAVLLDGDGDGLVDAAAAGLLSGNELVVYGAALDRTTRSTLTDDTTIIVTDTNRRRERRWRSTRYTAGLTDRAGNEQPDTGHGEADLVVFPDATDADRSVAVQRGATVDASLYGTLVTFDTDQRAVNALDGDPRTAWEIGAITDPVGERLRIRLAERVSTDHIDLLQAQGGFRTRLVDEVVIRFDDGDVVRRTLDDASLDAPGQRIDFPRRSFDELEIEIASVRETAEVVARGGSATGFAEVAIPGVEVEELVRMPVGLVRGMGQDSAAHPLVYVMTRLRSNPAERIDEEASLRRIFEVPDGRTFTLDGSARLSAAASDDAFDAAVGAPGPAEGQPAARASGSLPGALDQRPRAAIDGDPTTHWTSTFFEQAGAWIEVELAAPTTIDALDLAVVADGRHSVPTGLRIESGGTTREVTLPALTDEAMPDAVVDVPVSFEPITGSTFRVTITSVREVTSADAFSGRQLPLPLAIADVGLPAVAAPLPETLPTACRDDLVTIDGAAVPVRIVGDTSDAVDRSALRIEPCGPPIELSSGRHVLRATPGRDTGIDLDRLVLRSDRAHFLTGERRSDSPRLRVVDSEATQRTVTVPRHDDGMWLVLGESYERGWRARIEDGPDLGAPTLVNGFANGWHLPASDERAVVRLSWEPQGAVDVALVVTLVTLALCAVLVWRGRRWRPDDADDPDASIDLGIDASPKELGLPAGMLIVLGATAFTLLVVDPTHALVVGALVGLALAWRHGGRVLVVAALALMAFGFLGVVRDQARQDRVVGYEWTAGQESEHRAVLTGVCLLAAAPLVVTRRLRRPHTSPR
jgi:hypothetical protein